MILRIHESHPTLAEAIPHVLKRLGSPAIKTNTYTDVINAVINKSDGTGLPDSHLRQKNPISRNWSGLIIAESVLASLVLLWNLIFIFGRKLRKLVRRKCTPDGDSGSLYRAMVANAQCGLCLIAEEDGSVILQNERMKIYSDGTSALSDRILALCRPIEKDNNSSVSQALGEHDLVVINVAGERRQVMANIIRTRDEGRSLLWCSFFEVTAQKGREQGVLDAHIAADAVNQNAVLANVSHEIRTPLNGILGNLELLDRTQMSDLQRDRLRTVTSSSRALLDIINNILDFSKTESGHFSLEHISFDLPETVEDVISLFAPIVDSKRLLVSYRIAPHFPRHYVGDPTRFRQIVLNLLSNAIKFTDKGSISIELTTEITTQSRYAVLRIADTGIGIAPDLRTELFKPYVQLDPSVSRGLGGTGLGLALSTRLVNFMGGVIDVHGNGDAGSIFTIRVPLRVDLSKPVSLNALSNGEMKRLTVLCAIPDQCENLLACLREWGITPVIITHPKDVALTGVPLLLFGSRRSWSVNDEDRAGLLAGCIVDVSENGPRQPIFHFGRSVRILVSCYSSIGLHEAIEHSFAPHKFIPTVSESAEGGCNLLSTSKCQPLAESAVRVLVVEDHPVSLALIGDQLSLLGYAVTLAASAVDALQLFSNDNFDIVLTDLRMPTLDGFMLAKILREQGAVIPIIALTAYVLPEERQRCEKAGFDDIWIKPLSIEKIDPMLSKQLAPREFSIRDVVMNREKSNLTNERVAMLEEASLASINQIFSALATNQPEMMHTSLHSLAGAFAICNEQLIVDTCRDLERDCKSKLLMDLRNRVEMLEAQIFDAIKRLSSKV